MKIRYFSALLLAAVLLSTAEAEVIYDYPLSFDYDIAVTNGDLRVLDGAVITARSHKFSSTEGTTHFTMQGGQLVATADYGKQGMPCDDVEYAICMGYGPGYVVANLAGGEIICTNGLFCVSREAYTTCIVTGTVIRCRGFRLRAGEASGYATFILGPGGELDITGDWGLRSFHDPKINEQYYVGNKNFLYYLELRGGKIRFEESWLEGQGLEHAPCLIMAPDTESEFYVAEGKTVCYAGQLQGEGTLHKTGKGKLIFSTAYIQNEGTIVIDEGSIEMYTEKDLSKFYGDVVVKPGAALYLKGSNAKEIPDEVEVSRNGTVTVEDGSEVWFNNKTTGTNTKIDMNLAAENGGYVETRSNYRVGVNMNLGTESLVSGDGDGVNNQVVVQDDEVNVGGYPENGTTWGYTRLGKTGVAHHYSDVLRIYSRSDIQSYVRFSFYANSCGTSSAQPPYTNGNMRLTKRYFDDGVRSGQRSSDVFTAVNALYKEETVELPAPPNARAWQMRLEDIPYGEFDLYLVFAADSQGEQTTQYAPVNVRVTTADGKQTSGWRSYTYSNGHTERGDSNWGGEQYCAGTNMVEGTHFLKIGFTKSEAGAIGLENVEDIRGCTVDVAPGPVSRDSGGQWQVRAGIAGFQIVPSGKTLPELDINEYTSFTSDKNIYNLDEGESFRLDFTATNENVAIGFVHSISNDLPVAPRIVVNGKEFPRLPGAESRYTFDAANVDKIQLDVMYLPWRDNQTNDLTTAQLAWVKGRWGEEDAQNATPSNVALNAAAAIEGADRDGDEFPFQFEYITDSDLTQKSNPMHLAIVGRAISNDCLWLDVEYTRTENGVPATDGKGAVVPGWLGVTNGVNNAPYLRVGVKGGDSFSFENDRLRPFGTGLNRGVNAEFATSITNTISLPLIELTNRFFRATMEPK